MSQYMSRTDIPQSPFYGRENSGGAMIRNYATNDTLMPNFPGGLNADDFIEFNTTDLFDRYLGKYNYHIYVESPDTSDTQFKDLGPLPWGGRGKKLLLPRIMFLADTRIFLAPERRFDGRTIGRRVVDKVTTGQNIFSLPIFVSGLSRGGVYQIDPTMDQLREGGLHNISQLNAVQSGVFSFINPRDFWKAGF